LGSDLEDPFGFWFWLWGFEVESCVFSIWVLKKNWDLGGLGCWFWWVKSVELGKLKVWSFEGFISYGILLGAFWFGSNQAVELSSWWWLEWKFEDLRSNYVLWNSVQDQEVGFCYFCPYFELSYAQLGFSLLILLWTFNKISEFYRVQQHLFVTFFPNWALDSRIGECPS
jgi:hypothetical protein